MEKDKRVALPRQVAMFLVRQCSDAGFREIADCFGGKDHTIIIHACRKISDSLKSDMELQGAITELTKLVQRNIN